MSEIIVERAKEETHIRDHSHVDTYEYRGWKHVTVTHGGGVDAFMDVINEIEDCRSEGYEIVNYYEHDSRVTILFNKGEVE